MDRREALRLIGAGGVTVVGMSAISSGRAFAYQGPTLSGMVGASMSSVNSTISLGIQPADGTCGASSTSAGGQVEVTNLALTLSTMSIESGKHFGGAGFGTTSMVNAVAHDFTTLNYATSTTAGLSAGLTTIYYIRKFTPPSTGALPAVGDAIRAQITVTYQCSFSGGVATTDQSIDMLFTYNGSVWNQTTFAPG